MITLDRKAFSETFALAASAVPTRTAKYVLKNVLMSTVGSTLTLKGSDGEIHVSTEMEIENHSFKLAALLPSSRITSILNEIDRERLTIEIEPGKVILTCGDARFTLQSGDPAEYPPIPDCDVTNYRAVSAADLRRMLNRTMFACDEDSTRYALGGVQFEFTPNELVLAATDSRRLCVEQALSGNCGHPAVSPIVVPKRALNLVEKALGETEVRIVAGTNSIAFNLGTTTIYSQLVQGRFPNYRLVIPKEHNGSVTVIAKHVLSMARQAIIATNEESRGVDFKFTASELVVSSQAAEIGQAKTRMPIAYTGPEMTICLDGRYVAEFLKTAGDQTIDVKLIAPDDRMLCECGSWKHVIMPLAKE